MSIQGIPQSSTLNREAKALVNRSVQNGRGSKTIKSAMPVHQALTHHHTPVFYTNSFKSVPVNLFRNNGARYSGNIEQKSFTKLKSATLKVSITISGFTSQAVQLTPVTHWFDRIEVRSNNGSNHLGIMTNDQLAFNLNMLSNDKLKNVLPNCNIDSETWTTPAVNGFVGETKLDFYLPLIGSYLDINQYFSNIKGDLVIDFTPSSNIGCSTTNTGSVDCNGMELIIETENLSNEDEKTHEVYHNSIISSNRVLDFVPVVEYGKTLTANSVSTIDLDSVVGKTAGIVLLVKKSGATNIDNNSSSFVDLGDTATIDLVTSGGKSILGSGIPLTGQYIKNEIWATHFDTDYSRSRNAYYIPFTGDCKASLKGVIDGYLNLDSSGHKLQIKPAPVGIATKQELTVTHAGTSSALLSGGFCLEFMGERTDRLTYNSTVASIEGFVNKLKTMRNYRGGALTATFSKNFEDGTAVYVSFNEGRVVDEQLRVVNLGLKNTTGDDVSYHTRSDSTFWVNTDRGTSGFISGQYDVHCYAMVYRDIHSHQGKISTELS